MSDFLRRKSFDALSQMQASERLKPTLSWYHLMALGVGAIVGTGIYTLIGVGAGLAGPGVILSFAIAGAVCACAALAYAEMATMIRRRAAPIPIAIPCSGRCWPGSSAGA